MHLVEVTDKKTAAEFIQIAVQINKSNPAYIRPLDNEVNEVFDPLKNKFFNHGEPNVGYF